VQDCTNAADFRVHIWDPNEVSEPLAFRPDKKTRYICLPHAVANETLTPETRQRDQDYPITKQWAGEKGWTVYSALRQATKIARQAIRYFPQRKGRTPPIENRVRAAFRDGEVQAAEPCSFEDCPYPATFVAWKGHVQGATRGARVHGIEKLCAEHAEKVAATYPLTPDAGWIFFRPLIPGLMSEPPALRGRIIFDEEYRPVAKHGYQSPMRSSKYPLGSEMPLALPGEHHNHEAVIERD